MNSTDSQSECQPKKKKYFHHNIEDKLMTIEEARKTSVESAAKKYKVDPKCIRDWRVKESELKDMKDKGGKVRKRLDGGGRKLQSYILEVLFKCFENERHEMRCVSPKGLM
jgi:uncharacterized membrane protein